MMCAEFGTRWKVGMLYVLVQVSEQVEESESSLSLSWTQTCSHLIM